MDLVLVVLGVLGILVGLAGVVIPFLPGLLFVWLGTVGTLLAYRADATAWVLVGLLTVLFIVGSIVTIALPTRTGVQGGASPRSLLLAVAGGVAGFFLLPVLGVVVGAVTGLAFGERHRLGDWAPAWASTRRVLRAYGIGVIVEFLIGVLMALIWVAAVVLRG